jgi:hypothetical protein
LDIITFPEIFQLPLHSRIAVAARKGVNNLESDELAFAAATKLRNMQ